MDLEIDQDRFVQEKLDSCCCDSRWCCNVSSPVEGEEITDDSVFYTRPIRVGKRSVLFCGKKSSYFPFHCLVGPDWPIVLLVYTLIIVIDLVIIIVTRSLGWPIVLVESLGFVALLLSYSAVACSDPGIIFKEKVTYGGSSMPDAIPINNAALPEDIEKNLLQSHERSPDTANSINSNTRQIIPDNRVIYDPTTMACGHCNVRRPLTARHCGACNTCIDGLDHHCPWSGKCIGKKNMMAFKAFLGILNLQCYLLAGVLIYFIVAPFNNWPNKTV